MWCGRWQQRLWTLDSQRLLWSGSSNGVRSFGGDLFQLRSSFEELSSAYPDHARRLRELSAALEQTSASREAFLSAFSDTQSATHRAKESSQQEVERHRTLAIKRDKLLQEIRRFPGFEQFLLHKDFSQLRASVHARPVVFLNAAETRCDALIMLADVERVLHVPLPNFTFQRSAGLQNMLAKLLGHARVMPSDDSDRKGGPCNAARRQLGSSLIPLVERRRQTSPRRLGFFVM